MSGPRRRTREGPRAPKASRAKGAAAGIAAVVAAAGAGEALAGGGGVKTNVTLKSVEPQGANGRVTSPKKACVRGRKVTLHYVIKGEKNPRVGSDKTNRKGKFEIEEPLFAGAYYAKVAKKSLGKKGYCKAKKSKRKKG